MKDPKFSLNYSDSKTSVSCPSKSEFLCTSKLREDSLGETREGIQIGGLGWQNLNNVIEILEFDFYNNTH